MKINDQEVVEMAQKDGNIVHRVIGRCGATFRSLRYNNPELDRIRASLRGQKTKIKYDLEDLSYIRVWYPSGKRYVEVPAVRQK